MLFGPVNWTPRRKIISVLFLISSNVSSHTLTNRYVALISYLSPTCNEIQKMKTAGAKEYCHKTKKNEEPICRSYHYEKGLIGGAHMNGCDVYATIGGDGSSGEVLSMVASDKEARKNFTESCVWLIENYDFDGIDIAWEVRISGNSICS